MFKNILFSMMFLVSSVLANTLGLEDNGDGTWNVTYSSEESIAGFQFNVDDATVNSASGGDATANGFMISANTTTVLGFSLTGGTIPAGNGTLVVLDLSGTPSGLSGIVMSDPSGNAIEFTYDSGDDCPSGDYDCAGECDGDAVEDCAGDCGGSAANDECGVCGGDNSSCADCAGVPNGDSVICWDGSCSLPDDCPDQPGGSVEVYYNTSTPIAGFQFNVDGVTVTGASGGDATANGFMISSNATTVIGFSLTGATIPAGEGVLIVLEVDGNTADACLSGVVISDSDGVGVDVMVEDCTSIVEEGGGDVYGCTDMDACNYNADATADDGSCDYAS